MGIDAGNPVDLRLLGGFTLSYAGRVVRVAPGGRRLLALLALRGPGRRPRLAALLWPDEPDHRAQANLRVAVWRLRRCAVPVVVAGAESLRLSPAVRVDIHQPGRAGTALPELLPGWPDDWVVAERERVRQALLHEAERQAAEAIDRGDAATGLGLARAVVRAGPLRESGHRLVVRAHLAAGDAARAHRHFEAARQLLRRELDVPPTPRFWRLLAAGPGAQP